MDPVLLYLILINAVGFLLMRLDKKKAQQKKWRIPEAVLMGVAFIGGSAGSLLGMYVFRHKTLHPKFVIGVPAMLMAHLVLAATIAYNVLR